MHDYDVGALGLSVPPSSAVIQSYRPAVLVRNNGVHEAYASGYLRIYAADLLIFETEVYSAGIAPGATGLAQATDYWTPPAAGKYMIFGAVTCPLDQYEPNDHLNPVTILVTGLPPPTPPPVLQHAAQHEEGAVDEVSIDGLKGRAADPQTALAHVASHQAGGSDQLSVGALLGELAQDQPAKFHGNARHAPMMATSSALSSHQAATTVHSAATNLANREPTGVFAGLVPGDQLILTSAVPRQGFLDANQGLSEDRYFRAVNPIIHAFSHDPTGDDPIATPTLLTAATDLITAYAGGGKIYACSLALSAAHTRAGCIIELKSGGLITCDDATLHQLLIGLEYIPSDNPPVSLASATINLPPSTTYQFAFKAHAGISANLNWQSFLDLTITDLLGGTGSVQFLPFQAFLVPSQALPGTLALTAHFILGNASQADFWDNIAFALLPSL